MSIVHVKSVTISDFTGTVTAFNSQGSTTTVAASALALPSDWNSSHNMVLNLGGNTAGTSQISGADLVWAGGNGITLSANGSTVSVVAGNYLTTAAQSNHSHNFATTTTTGSVIVVGTTNSAGATIGVPPFLTNAGGQVSFYLPEIYGASLTNAHANGTVYLRPFTPGGQVDVDRVLFQQSYASSATTMSISASVSAGNATSGTASFGQSGTLLLFSRQNTNETNASFNSIITFASNSYSHAAAYSMSASWSTNASSATCSFTTSAAVSYIANIDTAGGVTMSSTTGSGSSSFSSTSTNANSFSSSFVMSFPYAHMSGVRPLHAPVIQDLTAGDYWMGIIQSTNTGTTNWAASRILVTTPGMLYYTASTNNYMEMGNSVAITSGNWRPGFGSYSASGNTTTAINLTAISSMASNASMHFALMGYTL